jgi:integrase/recombinase XerC
MTTIQEAMTRYRNVLEVTHAKTSIKTYMSRLRFLVNELGDTFDITELRLLHLERSLANYKKTRSNNTTALCVTVWREFCAWCHDVEILPTNPALRLRAPRRTKWQPRAMSEAALQDLLQRMHADVDSSDWRQLRNEIMVRFLVWTGLRRAEIAALSWSDVDIDGALLSVVGKGNKRRTIPLTRTGISLLCKLQQLQGRNYGAIFAKADGTSMHPYTINIIFQRWIQTGLGVPITPHVLRHTFATMLVDRGAALDEVRDLLGHESIATTQIYINTSLARLRKAVEKLERDS